MQTKGTSLTHMWRIHAALGDLRRKINALAVKPSVSRGSLVYAFLYARYIRDLPRRLSLECQYDALMNQPYAYAVA
jgi:hypothetical protein